MENKYEKEKVMLNLRQLNGTEIEFGKIGVTENYTIEERHEIKYFEGTRLSKKRIAPGETHQAIAPKQQNYYVNNERNNSYSSSREKIQKGLKCIYTNAGPIAK